MPIERAEGDPGVCGHVAQPDGFEANVLGQRDGRRDDPRSPVLHGAVMHDRFRPGEPPARNAQAVVGFDRATLRERYMKVVVDYDLCEANAVCVDQAPEVFRVDENDNLHVLIENPSEALRKKVEAAVRLCPRQALSITE